MNHFDPNYIRRRPNLDDDNEPTEILRWSNHRVMDWLRSIDLAEFAPNLRGSGVCGALMVKRNFFSSRFDRWFSFLLKIFESRFNASTLAEILSIPTSKTLLRRHLTKSFEELIGLDIHNRKNQYEKSFRCPTLTRHSKIKVCSMNIQRKKNRFSILFEKIPRRLFSSQRRTSSVDLVCPIDDKEIDSNFPSNLSVSREIFIWTIGFSSSLLLFVLEFSTKERSSRFWTLKNKTNSMIERLFSF